jgi:signal transduction histidine kinase
VAALVLALSVAGTATALLATRVLTDAGATHTGELLYVASQILPFGVVGAVLVARRPDLPFGWLLSLGAMVLVLMVAVVGASLAALEHGYGGEAAVWGLTAGSLLFVPVALQGVINVRFPSGNPSGRAGRVLERLIVAGIVLSLLGGLLGSSTVDAFYPDGPPGGASRWVDDTSLAGVGDLATVAVPVVILLGGIAGIGVVVRFLRSEGLERLQLRWRAVGVVGTLLLFPLAVTEVLPEVVADLDALWFVSTLAVPVLRHDLWAIDSIIRRSATATFTSPATVVENTARATAEMLRLPYIAVRRDDRVLASYGEPTDVVETWPLVDDGEPVGNLVASPRHGYDSFTQGDRQVLATVAQLVGGSVRAEALTADLLDARQRLVTAREEERRRLRRDLHDGLGPLLTGLGLNLDAATAQLGVSDDKAATYLANAKDASTQVITSLRELVDGLRPPALDELGLAGALKLHVGTLAADARLALHLEVPDHPDRPAATEVAVFRMVVEAVTNVARHGEARHVQVQVAESSDVLVVTVTDDGPARTPWAAGVGLTGMRDRAEELGGTFSAGPTPVGGCVRGAYPLGDRG